jgi:hypothetical protein
MNGAGAGFGFAEVGQVPFALLLVGLDLAGQRPSVEGDAEHHHRDETRHHVFVAAQGNRSLRLARKVRLLDPSHPGLDRVEGVANLPVAPVHLRHAAPGQLGLVREAPEDLPRLRHHQRQRLFGAVQVPAQLGPETRIHRGLQIRPGRLQRLLEGRPGLLEAARLARHVSGIEDVVARGIHGRAQLGEPSVASAALGPLLIELDGGRVDVEDPVGQRQAEGHREQVEGRQQVVQVVPAQSLAGRPGGGAGAPHHRLRAVFAHARQLPCRSRPPCTGPAAGGPSPSPL